MKYITSIFIIFGALLFQPNLIMAQSDMDQFEVKVEGLGCPFCAYGLEKKFNELESIKKIKIDIETGVLSFQFPFFEMLSIKDVEAQVDAAGYTAAEVKVKRANGALEESGSDSEAQEVDSELLQLSFFVAGNCGMCKERIEKGALSIDAVVTAEWNQASKMLQITYKDEQLSQEDIENAIALLGHDTPSAKAEKEVYEALPECCQYDRKN